MASDPTKPALPARGYHVLYLGLGPNVLDALLREAQTRDFKPVFQEVGGEMDDQFRAQSRVTPRESSPALNEFPSRRRDYLEPSVETGRILLPAVSSWWGGIGCSPGLHTDCYPRSHNNPC